MLPVTLLLSSIMLARAESSSYHVVLQSTGTDPPPNTKIGSMVYSARSAATFAISATSACGNLNVISSTSLLRRTSDVDQTCSDSVAPNATGISTTAIKVEAASPFDLQVFTKYPSSSTEQYEGYHAIPDESLGQEYYAVTYCTMGGVCQLSVTAIKNNTFVTVQFAKTVITTVLSCLSSTSNGAELHIVLNELDVLHIESSDDLTGTRIIAEEPVAVFAGARNVPSVRGTYAFTFEQMTPVSSWGTRHFMVPNVENPAGDLIKIVTRDNSTTVTITGFSPFIIPGAGDSIVRRIDWGSYSVIESSYPVMIAHISSVDLYNDTIAVTGYPSMLLLQVADHWQTVQSVSCPSADAGNIFALIIRTDNKASLRLTDQTGDGLTINATGWSVFPGSEVSLNIFKDTTPRVSVHSSMARVGIYAFCSIGGIFTSGMNLATGAQVCVNSLAMPGDGVDNDCDGQIDSVQCTEHDKKIYFTSTQNLNGSADVLTINPTGIESVRFSLSTCGVAVIQLRSSEEDHYVLFQFVGTNVTVEQCSPECVQVPFDSLASTICSAAQEITIFWLPVPTNDTTRRIQMFAGQIEVFNNLPPITRVEYDRLMFSSLGDPANFAIDLMQKDCAKIKSGGYFDSHGSQFIIPVESTEEFYIYITPASGVTVTTNEGQQLLQHTSIQTTVNYTELNPTNNIYRWLTLETTGEVTVYLMTRLGEMHVIPVDVLGPAYTLNAIANGPPVCKVYPVGSQVHVLPDEEVVTARNGRYTYMSDIPVDNYMYSAHLSALFCLQWNSSVSTAWLQIPPLETLGSKDMAYYVPAMDFVKAKISTATLHITTTADSTYLQVTGDFSEEIVKDRRGETYKRDVTNNQIYKITVGKAVLVILVLVNTVDPTLKVSVVIPHASQYTTSHVVPGIITNLLGSYGVSDNGTHVNSKVGENTTVQTLTYQEPTFTITLYNFWGKTMRVLLSDIKYEQNNERCLVNSSTTADSSDNDCDGLTDEEVCVSLIAGEVDSDIDGSINEDCGRNSATYSVPSTAMSVNFTAEDINCSTEPITTPITTVAPPPTPTLAPVTIQIPPLKSTTSAPTLAPVTTSAGVIQVATTTPAPGSTAAPVETCTTSCYCPCGWVSAQNLTETQIKEAVAEIQEKLKIDKKTLSAAVRKKTSAKDDRTSATAVGYAGLAFLIVCIGSIVLLDFTTITRDLRLLRENIRQLFQI